jgi:hypothetical protein
VLERVIAAPDHLNNLSSELQYRESFVATSHAMAAEISTVHSSHPSGFDDDIFALTLQLDEIQLDADLQATLELATKKAGVAAITVEESCLSSMAAII